MRCLSVFGSPLYLFFISVSVSIYVSYALVSPNPLPSISLSLLPAPLAPSSLSYPFSALGLVHEGYSQVEVGVRERHELRPLRGDGDPAPRHVRSAVSHHLDRVRRRGARGGGAQGVGEPCHLGEFLEMKKRYARTRTVV